MSYNTDTCSLSMQFSLQDLLFLNGLFSDTYSSVTLVMLGKPSF